MLTHRRVWVLRAPTYGTDPNFFLSPVRLLLVMLHKVILVLRAISPVRVLNCQYLRFSGGSNMTLNGNMVIRTGAANTDGGILVASVRRRLVEMLLGRSAGGSGALIIRTAEPSSSSL